MNSDAQREWLTDAVQLLERRRDAQVLLDAHAKPMIAVARLQRRRQAVAGASATAIPRLRSDTR
jgi:hypothetical protein